MNVHAQVKDRNGRLPGAARVWAMLRRREIEQRRERGLGASAMDELGDETGIGAGAVEHMWGVGGVGVKLSPMRGVVRDLADAVKALGPALEDGDYALLEAAVVQGTSITLLASLRGESPGKIRRRVKMLLRLVLAFEFEFVIRNRREWTPRMRVVADACILRGLSIRQAAALLRMSPDQVRRERARVLRLAASKKAA